MADWQAIKTEYITTNTSYRKLAQKYGVSHVQIGNVGKQENWVELRRQYLDNTFTKTVDAIAEQQVDRATKFQLVADKLMGKVEALAGRKEPLDPKSIRALSAAMKDLKEILGLRSELDKQEQEARIANLRKQADRDEGGKEPVSVVIGEDLADYCK